MTVTAALSLAPPAAAVIVVLPECTAVTRPAELIVATEVFELDHATPPESTLPLASASEALNCLVPPVASVALAGVTVTVCTAPAETTTLAVPVAPFSVAEIVALPVCTPVTTPDDDTVAVFVLELDHATVCAPSALPAASVSETESCCVPPATRPTEAGVTAID